MNLKSRFEESLGDKKECDKKEQIKGGIGDLIVGI